MHTTHFYNLVSKLSLYHKGGSVQIIASFALKQFGRWVLFKRKHNVEVLKWVYCVRGRCVIITSKTIMVEQPEGVQSLNESVN